MCSLCVNSHTRNCYHHVHHHEQPFTRPPPLVYNWIQRVLFLVVTCFSIDNVQVQSRDVARTCACATVQLHTFDAPHAQLAAAVVLFVLICCRSLLSLQDMITMMRHVLRQVTCSAIQTVMTANTRCVWEGGGGRGGTRPSRCMQRPHMQPQVAWYMDPVRRSWCSGWLRVGCAAGVAASRPLRPSATV